MAKEIINSFHLQVAMRTAIDKAVAYRNPYFTPEHLICAIMVLNPVREALESLGISVRKIVNTLDDYIKHLDKIPDDKMHSIDPSLQFQEMIMGAIDIMHASAAPELEVTHIIQAAMNLQDSLAGNLLNFCAEKDSEFLATIIWQVERYAKEFPIKGADMSGSGGLLIEEKDNKKDVFLTRDWGYDSPEDEMIYSKGYRDSMEEDERERDVEETFPFVTCINDHLKEHNPLIGREAELERTIHVLCRKDKNNPLHVGEPGVGKTALIYGLAQRIEDGDVPDVLRGAKIYQIDMAAMVAGTQYRGDFEKRVKQTMDYLSRLDNAIVYIDEIHSIVGTGATGESAMDASNMLKPYLEGGKLRFIGSTTYEEFNRQLSRSKGIVRRFQQIDILEPTVDETIEIINGLKERYESFHKVKYVPAAIDYAVRASDKHIMGRFLPDKAIDLIDEAGAYRHIHPTNKKRQMVDKALIDDVLKKVMKINATHLSGSFH